MEQTVEVKIDAFISRLYIPASYGEYDLVYLKNLDLKEALRQLVRECTHWKECPVCEEGVYECPHCGEDIT